MEVALLHGTEWNPSDRPLLKEEGVLVEVKYSFVMRKYWFEREIAKKQGRAGRRGRSEEEEEEEESEGERQEDDVAVHHPPITSNVLCFFSVSE